MPISKRNRRGVIVLLAIAGCAIYTPRILMAFKSDEKPIVSFQEFKKVEREIKESKEETKQSKEYKRKSRYKKPPKAFNPNDYSKEEWMFLGLSEKQTDVVLKFTSRGIYSSRELKKIYVIPDELYELVKDSIVYPEKMQFEEVALMDNELIPSKLYLDLNSASAKDLEQLKGIGPFYAEKIIERRKQLGGFYDKMQLLEIWKFDQEKLEQIQENIFLGTTLQQIDINEASIDGLKAHPYITYKVANSIVKMREVNGGYDSVDDIKRSKLIDDALYQKIYKYLKV